MAPLTPDFARYAGLGLQFAFTLVAFGALGWWLDSRLGSDPWLMVAGIFVGAAAAFLALLRAVPAPRSRAGSGREPREPPQPPSATPPR